MLGLAPWLLREQTQKSEWIAFVFSIVGLGILYTGSFGGSGMDDILGITLGVLSAFCLAVLFVMYRLLAREALRVATINFWRHLISTIILVPIILSVEKVSYAPAQISVLIIFGFLFALVASGINNFALMRSRGLHATIIAKSEPVFAGIYAFLIFGEKPTIQLLLGGALIVASGIWLATQKKD
jgi:drug/metabolite transporter (DMT)-like permease